MAVPKKPKETKAPEKPAPTGQDGQQETAVAERAPVAVLSGAEEFIGGESHVGVAVNILADGKSSSIVIPDAKGVKTGKSPIYLTRPIAIKFKNLLKFFEEKGVTLPEPVTNLLKKLQITCDAFYYVKSDKGPVLMMITMETTDKEKGFIGILTGSEALGSLFDIQGVAVRVLQIPDQGAFDILKKYVAQLTE